jgi:hypothetical protein
MRTRNKSQLLLIFLAVGFLVGILYRNIISGREMITTELFLKSNLQRYLHTNIIAEKYLFYVVKERLFLFGVILLLGCIRWKKVVVGICISVTGFIMGVLTVSAILQLGIKGIFFCLTALFPQSIFYGCAVSIMLVYWYWYPKRPWNRVKTIFVILIFILGILMEVYVNPILVKWVIKML